MKSFRPAPRAGRPKAVLAPRVERLLHRGEADVRVDNRAQSGLCLLRRYDE